MHRLAIALMFAGCAAKPGSPAVQRAAPVPVVPTTLAPPESIWPVPVRVMTWTPEGVEQVGELPDQPPASPPATPWYVEPTRPLDAAGLAKLAAALRSEHVPGLSLRDQPLAKAALAELHDLPELSALICDDTTIDSAAIAGLALPLRRLYLARTQLDDRGVAALVAHPALADLEVLDLEDTAVTDLGVKALIGFAKLRAVNLAGTRISDTGGARLAALPELAIVDLGGTRVGRQTVRALATLRLREIFLDHTRVAGEIALLAPLAPNLVRFDVSSLDVYKPAEADVKWLASATSLVEVGLSGSLVGDPLVRALAAQPEVRVMRLAETRITRVSVEAIAKLDKLVEVDLAETPVDDSSAAALVGKPRMRMLRLDGTPITDAALATAPGPRLEELYVSRTRVGDGGLAILDRTPNLEGLGLGDLLLGDATLARVGKLVHLRTLVLSRARTGRTALGELGKLRRLERLYLDETRAGDETIAALAKLDQLRVLHLAGTDVSEESLPTLRSFGHLDELTLGDTRMREAVVDLAAWPRLRTLSLQGLEITDDALPELAKRRSLVTLDLSATEVRDPAPLAALPQLRVLGLAGLRLSPSGEAAVEAIAARGVEVVR